MTKIKDDPRVYHSFLELRVEADPKRARNEKGHLVADDPSTLEVNEAWEGGKAPKEKTPKKKAKPRGKKSTSKS